MRVVSVPAWIAATNAYLVFEEQDGVAFLVDAPPEPELIAEVVLENRVTLGGLLLTHGHVDHSGGAGVIESSFGAEVYVHPDDDFLTLHPEEQARRLMGMLPPGSYELPQRFHGLSDGDKLTFGGHTIETRHTPGHTPGHCCFYMEEQEILFSGDQLFSGSIGRTDLPGGSMPTLLSSMKTKVLTLHDDVRVLPGHGPETTIGTERRSNPFLRQL